MAGRIEARLKQLGVELPEAREPRVARIKGANIAGNILYVSGQVPQWNGALKFIGKVGDAFQAFGPALAHRGLAVLAPDAITFEDRRAAVQGVEPADGDWLQHYNAMTYRLLDGDLLMRKCLDDAQRALSVLLHAAKVDERLVGVAGHSYGGYTALYHAAVDARCSFACVSGAVCSLETRRREGTGITMFEVVPGLARQLGTHDLLSSIRPRPMLIVSGTDDKYSRDVEFLRDRAEELIPLVDAEISRLR